jgi:hypothetical protein
MFLKEGVGVFDLVEQSKLDCVLHQKNQKKKVFKVGFHF